MKKFTTFFTLALSLYLFCYSMEAKAALDKYGHTYSIDLNPEAEKALEQIIASSDCQGKVFYPTCYGMPVGNPSRIAGSHAYTGDSPYDTSDGTLNAKQVIDDDCTELRSLTRKVAPVFSSKGLKVNQVESLVDNARRAGKAPYFKSTASTILYYAEEDRACAISVAQTLSIAAKGLKRDLGVMAVDVRYVKPSTIYYTPKVIELRWSLYGPKGQEPRNAIGISVIGF